MPKCLECGANNPPTHPTCHRCKSVVRPSRPVNGLKTYRDVPVHPDLIANARQSDSSGKSSQDNWDKVRPGVKGPFIQTHRSKVMFSSGDRTYSERTSEPKESTPVPTVYSRDPKQDGRSVSSSFDSIPNAYIQRQQHSERLSEDFSPNLIQELELEMEKPEDSSGYAYSRPDPNVQIWDDESTVAAIKPGNSAELLVLEEDLATMHGQPFKEIEAALKARFPAMGEDKHSPKERRRINHSLESNAFSNQEEAIAASLFEDHSTMALTPEDCIDEKGSYPFEDSPHTLVAESNILHKIDGNKTIAHVPSMPEQLFEELNNEDILLRPSQEHTFGIIPDDASDLGAPTISGVSFQDLVAHSPLLQCSMPPAEITPSTTHDRLIGKQFGNFRIEEKIGYGGFGNIYRATQLFLQKSIAVKVLHIDLQSHPDILQRFQREAKALAELRHENVVQLSDFGELPGLGFYISMELIDGKSLHERLEKGEAFPLERIYSIAKELSEVLRYVHKKGIIHRDLKPSNIILYRDESGQEHIKLIDFGIASIQKKDARPDTKLTRIGAQLGTIRYTSPEQIESKTTPDERSDLYSAATILYRLFAGDIPYDGSVDVMLMNQKTKHPAITLDAKIPYKMWAPELIEFFQTALSISREERQSNASEFWEQARKALDAQKTIDRPSQSSPNVTEHPTEQPTIPNQAKNSLERTIPDGLSDTDRSNALKWLFYGILIIGVGIGGGVAFWWLLS